MANPYWIDASVLITAKNKHYGFKLVPQFQFVQGKLNQISAQGKLHEDCIDLYTKFCGEGRKR